MSIQTVQTTDYFPKLKSCAKKCDIFLANLYEIGVCGILKDMKHVITSTVLPKKTIPGSNTYAIIEKEGYFYSRMNVSPDLKQNRDALNGNTNPANYPGCSFEESGKECDTCVQYAFEGYQDLHPNLKVHFKRELNDDFEEILDLPTPGRSFLPDWNNISPLDAMPGDAIFYFYDGDSFPRPEVVHVGIVEKVDRSVNPPRLSVKSKWGVYPVFLHNVDMLPQYGDHFVIMRSPYREQLKNSLAEKIRTQYKTFISGFTSLSLIGIAYYSYKWMY